MSKAEQNRAAQKIKKTLKSLGVKMNMKVSQEVGEGTIAIFISNGVWEQSEGGYIVVLDQWGDIERLTHDEYTTILNEPTEEETAEYLNKHWSM